MPEFSTKSKARLATCDVRLQTLFNEVIKTRDCTVVYGHRNQEDQEDCCRRGVSKAHWPTSPHNSTPSRAADVIPYPVDWNDLDRFVEFSDFVKETAARLGIKIKWGGNFTHLVDMPHYQIEGE